MRSIGCIRPGIFCTFERSRRLWKIFRCVFLVFRIQLGVDMWFFALHPFIFYKPGLIHHPENELNISDKKPSNRTFYYLLLIIIYQATSKLARSFLSYEPDKIALTLQKNIRGDPYGRKIFRKFFFLKNDPITPNFMRGIDCAHSRTLKTLP